MTTITTVQDLGRAVVAARKQAGMTQRDLALVAGVGNRFIVDLEAGKQTVRFGLVLQVLNVLGVSLSHDAPATGAGS